MFRTIASTGTVLLGLGDLVWRVVEFLHTAEYAQEKAPAVMSFVVHMRATDWVALAAIILGFLGLFGEPIIHHLLNAGRSLLRNLSAAPAHPAPAPAPSVTHPERIPNRALLRKLLAREEQRIRTERAAPKPQPHAVIGWRYLPDSPLNHAWGTAYGDSGAGAHWLAAVGAPVAGSMAMHVAAGFAMDTPIGPSVQLCNRIAYTVKFTNDTMLFAQVQMASRDASQITEKWIKFALGARLPHPTKGWEEQEWTLYLDGVPLPDEWREFNVSLINAVNSTWGTLGWVFRRLRRVRLRGSLAISPIELYQDTDSIGGMAMPVMLPGMTGRPPAVSIRYATTSVSFLGFRRETMSYEQYAERVEEWDKKIAEIKKEGDVFAKAKPTPWTEPVIFESEPRQLAAEPHLAWWHISITSRNDDGRPCRILLRTDGSDRDIPLLWATDDGPRETIVLQRAHGEYHVPVLARCVVNVMLSGDPRKLRHFSLPAGVARITDADALLHNHNFTDLAPGHHRIRVYVQEEGQEAVPSPEYVVNIPTPDADNTSLSIEPA